MTLPDRDGSYPPDMLRIAARVEIYVKNYIVLIS